MSLALFPNQEQFYSPFNPSSIDYHWSWISRFISGPRMLPWLKRGLQQSMSYFITPSQAIWLCHRLVTGNIPTQGQTPPETAAMKEYIQSSGCRHNTTIFFNCWSRIFLRQKGQISTPMHRLQKVKQHNDQKPVPIAPYILSFRTSTRSNSFHQAGPKKCVPSDTDKGGGRVEDCLQYTERSLQIPGHAVWILPQLYFSP